MLVRRFHLNPGVHSPSVAAARSLRRLGSDPKLFRTTWLPFDPSGQYKRNILLPLLNTILPQSLNAKKKKNASGVARVILFCGALQMFFSKGGASFFSLSASKQ
jgi:hypothetical protein